MTDARYVSSYFRSKGSSWKSTAGSIENYLTQKGRTGLKIEFQNDPNFKQVCMVLKNVGELQLRSNIYKSVEDLVGGLFGVPLLGTLDIVVSAAVEACGDVPLGDKLLESGVVSAIVVLGAIVLAAIFSD
ncbi:MAG: hypothetical protein ACP5UZ_08430 [Thermoplasmata archaeon]